MRVVGCFLEHEGKFLILLRHSHKPDGDTWGLPSGKVESGETDQAAVLRELEEETGYRADASEIEHIGDYDFVSSSSKSYLYCTYRVRLKNPHDVRLEESAHANYRWVTAEECDNLPNLILSFDKLLRLTGHVE